MSKNNACNMEIENPTNTPVKVGASGTNTHTMPAGPATLATAAPVQTDQSASRAKNTTYTNSDATHAIHVVVTGRCVITTLSGVTTMQGKSDSSTPPTTAVSGIVGIQAGLLGEDNSFEVSFWVAPSMKYRVDTVETTGTVTIGKWFETVF